MARFLILVAIIVGVAWWVLGRAARASARGNMPAGGRKPGPVQDVVSCAHCGVHLPRGDALADGERLYCSEDHRRLGSGSS